VLDDAAAGNPQTDLLGKVLPAAAAPVRGEEEEALVEVPRRAADPAGPPGVARPDELDVAGPDAEARRLLGVLEADREFRGRAPARLGGEAPELDHRAFDLARGRRIVGLELDAELVDPRGEFQLQGAFDARELLRVGRGREQAAQVDPLARDAHLQDGT